MCFLTKALRRLVSCPKRLLAGSRPSLVPWPGGSRPCCCANHSRVGTSGCIGRYAQVPFAVTFRIPLPSQMHQARCPLRCARCRGGRRGRRRDRERCRGPGLCRAGSHDRPGHGAWAGGCRPLAREDAGAGVGAPSKADPSRGNAGDSLEWVISQRTSAFSQKVQHDDPSLTLCCGAFLKGKG